MAQELGIADESLRRWIRQHEIDSGEREDLSTEELGRLRRENRVLRQEILIGRGHALLTLLGFLSQQRALVRSQQRPLY